MRVSSNGFHQKKNGSPKFMGMLNAQTKVMRIGSTKCTPCPKFNVKILVWCSPENQTKNNLPYDNRARLISQAQGRAITRQL